MKRTWRDEDGAGDVPKRPDENLLGPPSNGSTRGASPAPSLSAAPVGFARWSLAWADAFLAAALLLSVEFVFLTVVSLVNARTRGEFSEMGEHGLAGISLLLVALAVSGPVCLAGAGVLVSLRQAERPSSRVFIATLVALLAATVAWGLSAGRHFEGWFRPCFAVVVGLGCGLGSLWGVPLVSRRLAALTAFRPWQLVAVVLVAEFVLVLTNALALDWTYPIARLGLAAVSICTAAAVALVLPPWRGSRSRSGRGAVRQVPPAVGRTIRFRTAIASVLWVGATLWWIIAGGRYPLAQELRQLYSQRSPLLSSVLFVAEKISPIPPASRDTPLAPKRDQLAVDFRGRDILLVTIEAARADHLGAYGYSRPLSPNFDRLAREGVLFEAAYTPAPQSSYAIVSLMTGRYIRLLLRQGFGSDSATWASLMQRRGYRTAGFYPAAIFSIDRNEFRPFETSGLGFEHHQTQPATGPERSVQLRAFLKQLPDNKRFFAWVHLFEPHEPYRQHAPYTFGLRDVDRYDSELAAADAELGVLVQTARAVRPRTLVIVAADHGEEFGERGGRYHGSSVYDEQVRVPLVFNAPGLLSPRRVGEPVSLVDLLPTVATGLGMPLSPRVHGRDLGSLLDGSSGGSSGLTNGWWAFAETAEQSLWAEGNLRLLCARQDGFCRLYDTATDPAERRDVATSRLKQVYGMKERMAAWLGSIGRHETRGADGLARRPWPSALRRGLAGDGSSAGDVAGLLKDADVTVRRKAAEVLFELGQASAAKGLRQALHRDEDETVRRWCALALTRIGQGAPLSYDLLDSAELPWRQLAALALAEVGDARGQQVLIDQFASAFPAVGAAASSNGTGRVRSAAKLSFQRARQIVSALGKLRASGAVRPLSRGLRDVRLRPHIARALASIGDPAAVASLGEAFRTERYHHCRAALAEALVQLGAGGFLREPLVRFLGVPDPLPQGLELALRSGVATFVGGPRKRGLERLRRFVTTGVAVPFIVPEGGNGKGLRVLLLARSVDGSAGQIRFGLSVDPPTGPADRREPVPLRVPSLEPALTTTLNVAPAAGFQQLFADLPAAVNERVKPGEQADFVAYATQNVQLRLCVVVPLSDEILPNTP